MDPEIIQQRRSLSEFTLAELRKEIIKMKADKLAVTKIETQLSCYSYYDIPFFIPSPYE